MAGSTDAGLFVPLDVVSRYQARPLTTYIFCKFDPKVGLIF